MPNYNYQCQKCEHIQEESHPMSGPTETIRCYKCNSQKMEKTYLESTPPAAIFNGPGWCTNDDRGINKG